jgi:hypothetical protein
VSQRMDAQTAMEVRRAGTAQYFNLIAADIVAAERQVIEAAEIWYASEPNSPSDEQDLRVAVSRLQMARAAG